MNSSWASVTSQNLVDPVTVYRAGAVVCMQHYTLACHRKRFRERKSEISGKGGSSSSLPTSRQYAPSSLLDSSPHFFILRPVHALVRAVVYLV